MNAIRRAAVLIGLTLAVIVVGSIPASATFADWSARNVTVVSASVAPPTNVGATVRCDQWGTMHVRVSWTKSTARGITGYRLVAQGAGQTLQWTPGADATYYDHSMSRVWTAVPVSVTLTTLTSYGWTATSAPVTVTTC